MGVLKETTFARTRSLPSWLAHPGDGVPRRPWRRAHTVVISVRNDEALVSVDVELPASSRDRFREGHERAKAEDPTLGGFALIEAKGPDGLVADEAAEDAYFGRD